MEQIMSNFYSSTSLITYSEKDHSCSNVSEKELKTLRANEESIRWLNTYGLHFREDFKTIIQVNKLDDFLVKLLHDTEQSNKLVDLEHEFFLSINVLHVEGSLLETEQMYFIAAPSFLWSIQEKQGDYFEPIRDRIFNKKGLVRKKKADYLLFLIIEAIIENYSKALASISSAPPNVSNLSNINPSPEVIQEVEEKKQQLLRLKRFLHSLRDVVGKIGQIELENFNSYYFAELKGQASDLIEDVDYELQQLESALNLAFSLQGHRLNEIMKTLTTLSVIFIPLTFLAGIYGMNFKNIPELNTENGYFVLLGVMLVVTLGCIYFFKKKKWF